MRQGLDGFAGRRLVFAAGLAALCSMLAPPKAGAQGVTVEIYKPDLVYPGTTVFVDNRGSGQDIVEIDMQGKLLSKFSVPIQIQARRHRFASDLEWLPASNHFLYTSGGNGIFEFDRAGKIVWSHRTAKVTHDADRLDNGHTLYVFGFDADSDAQVTEVDELGKTVWEWKARPVLEGEQRHEAPPRMRQVEKLYSYSHANAVTRLANGNTLVSLRNFHMVVEVAPAGNIVWRWRRLPLVHDPEVLPDGHLLVALRVSPGYHPVREIDRDGKVVWEFTQPDVRVPTSCHRLPNGNTLIAAQNKFIEVTPQKEVAWRAILDGVRPVPEDTDRQLFKLARIPQSPR
jgi:hypothetical protein